MRSGEEGISLEVGVLLGAEGRLVSLDETSLPSPRLCVLTPVSPAGATTRATTPAPYSTLLVPQVAGTPQRSREVAEDPSSRRPFSGSLRIGMATPLEHLTLYYPHHPPISEFLTLTHGPTGRPMISRLEAPPPISDSTRTNSGDAKAREGGNIVA